MSRPTSTYGSVPSPNDTQVNRGYGNSVSADFAQGNPNTSSPLSQSMNPHQGPSAFHEDFDASQRGGSSIIHGGSADGGDAGLDRANSTATTAVQATPTRNNTLKKKGSVKRVGSLKRSSSRKSLKAGSVAGLGGVDSDQKYNSAFSTPVPTQGTPTEILANRFQTWRQLLKSLIAYFREIQSSYEMRAKAVHKVQSSIANITNPSVFMSENGLGEATRVLDEYHKRSIAEANKSRDIENDVIGALTGLRSDLGQKIKEIKSLSGDFKNSVEKEKDSTRREVEKLQEALQHADHEDGGATGKNDPFVVKLGVDRSVEKQIDEENYLHRAYLNLESSGRELESIVVGEIQKAYNALAGILKREGDDAYHTVEALRTGPIAMPKDAEWSQFVQHDPHFVDPGLPLRRVEDIHYPGKTHPAAQEVRAGMLERKSKYLKSYTPGWYILSATHLHEFKSAEKIYTQPPIMSLYLGDQQLGSRSQPGASSNKFMLKGKQSGSMHKGHNWVFRAESYDTMMAWFEDIRNLTESSGEQRIAYVRKHARSISGTSDGRTVSSDGMEEDEADAVPYTADARSLAEANPPGQRLQRPQPGGRFPSDMAVPRDGNRTYSPNSDSSNDAGVVPAAVVVPGTAQDEYKRNGQDPYRLDGVSAGTRPSTAEGEGSRDPYLEQTRAPVQQRNVDPQSQQPGTFAPDPSQEIVYRDTQQPQFSQQVEAPAAVHNAPLQQPMETYAQPQQQDQSFLGDEPAQAPAGLARHGSTYGDWMRPAAAGVAGAGAGAAGYAAYRNRNQDDAVEPEKEERPTSKDAPQTYQPSGYAAGPPDIATPNEGAYYVEDTPAAFSTAAPSAPVDPATRSVDATPTAFGTSSGAQPGAPSFPVSGGVDATPTAFSTSDTADPASSISMPPPGETTTLGGLESEGAHETGRFPKILRHDTDISVSRLHVPGEFPKGA